MTQYNCTITYTADATIARAAFSIAPSPDGAYLFNANDTIVFDFVGPGTVAAADLVLIKKYENEAGSPFAGTGAAPIPVLPGQPLTIDGDPGVWCFFMFFYAGTLGQQMLHYVPDPELQVGSIPKVA